jgi:hypothetical protein
MALDRKIRAKNFNNKRKHAPIIPVFIFLLLSKVDDTCCRGMPVAVTRSPCIMRCGRPVRNIDPDEHAIASTEFGCHWVALDDRTAHRTGEQSHIGGSGAAGKDHAAGLAAAGVMVVVAGRRHRGIAIAAGLRDVLHGDPVSRSNHRTGRRGCREHAERADATLRRPHPAFRRVSTRDVPGRPIRKVRPTHSTDNW